MQPLCLTQPPLSSHLGSMFSQAMKKWVQGNSDEVRPQDVWNIYKWFSGLRHMPRLSMACIQVHFGLYWSSLCVNLNTHVIYDRISSKVCGEISCCLCCDSLHQGPGGDGVADCQDDCQRRRPPVKPRQPRQVHQGTKPHSVVCFLCTDVWNDYNSSLTVFFCPSAVMTPLRNQRTVTPCRRWPSQWQTVHSVHLTMKWITLRTNKAFYHLPNLHVSVRICVAVSLGEWLFTHGLMEKKLKYIMVPVFPTP